MSQTAYPLKQDVALVVGQYAMTTRHHFAERTEIHAEGCSHTAKALNVHPLPESFGPDDGYSDDYYDVAPCARASNKRNQLTFA